MEFVGETDILLGNFEGMFFGTFLSAAIRGLREIRCSVRDGMREVLRGIQGISVGQIINVWGKVKN